MSKKILSMLSAILIMITALLSSGMTEAFALTQREPIVNYTFEDGTVLPQLYGNASASYDNERESNVLVLDGSDNTYAQLETGLFDNRDTVTISMDIKPQMDSGNFFTFSVGNDSTRYNFLRIRATEIRNAITVSSYSDEHEVKTNGAITDCWMNVSLVIDGTVSKIYVNGALKAVNSNTGIRISELGTGLLSYIGKSLYDGDAYYKGCFDNFRVYDYALNDSEIEGIFNENIDLYPLLNSITVGTVLDNVDNTDGTDSHTAVYADVDRTSGIIISGVKNSIVSSIPVTFALISDNAEIYIDGIRFTNGTRVNLSKDRNVEIKYADKSEYYILKTPTVVNNAILPGQYADPDIDYLDGRFWIFPTTDGAAGWGGTVFHAWSSVDLVNWTDEGVILDVADDNPGLNSKGIQIAASKWSDGNAWAPTIEEKNGKYYFYYCGKIKEEYIGTYGVADGSYNDKAIGVAVADNPAGPYTASDAPVVYPKMIKDTMSGSIISNNNFSGQIIDPSVFTDDDGTSYLFFGNGNAAFAKLNSDMTSVKTDSLKRITGMTDFREGVVVFKRNGTYYFTWSCDDTGSENYHVNYGTASTLSSSISIYKYIKVSSVSTIMAKNISAGILGTGHQSTLYLPGADRLFLVYHRFYTPLGQVGGNYGYHRETCIDELFFDSSNNIRTGIPTMNGVGYGVCTNGHNYELVSYTAPTCETDGEKVLRCANGECEITYTGDNLPQLKAYGHQWRCTEVQADCEHVGYTLYYCDLCSDEYKNDFVSASGHNLEFVNCENGDFHYFCDRCSQNIVKSPEELNAMWKIEYVNKPPNSTTADDSAYFELFSDGIINAKDYSVLIRNR